MTVGVIRSTGKSLLKNKKGAARPLEGVDLLPPDRTGLLSLYIK